MKIYGASVSPFVRKVIVTCEVKSLNYDIIPIIPFEEKPKFFRETSPLGKIPLFEDNEFIIPDSSVICSYLEEKYPKISILPQKIQDRARARWLEEYSDSKLVEVVGTKLFYELIVKPNFLNIPTNEELVRENLKTTLPDVMNYLETQVPQNGFIFSEKNLSIADISIASNMLNAKYANYTINKKKWPKLASYIERIHATPEFQKASSLDKKLLNL